MKTIHKVLILLPLIFLVACTPEKKQKSGDETGFTDQSGQKALKDAMQRDIYYRFPSAKEMLTYIKTEKLEYRTGLVNSVENLGNYHSTRAKTLNLGVYLADLSYMILFDKTQNTDQYFNAIFNLTNDLRIRIPNEQRVVERISNNIYESDSLINIADQYHTKIINHLLNTENEKTLAVITTGSYIEGLYIALNLVTDFEENKVTVDKIAAQKHAFKNLANFSQNFKEDLNTKYSLDYLKEINAFFKELPVIEEETTVKRTDKHTLMVGGGKKTKINRQKFEELKEKITEIREEIIKNEMNEE